MNNIVIKSIAGNRVRLKSDIFSKERNITLIKEHFESVIYNLRTNKQCSSIIFNHKQTLTPYDIVQQLNDLFLLSTPSKEHILSCSGGSCNSCNIKKHDPVTFRRKLFEFGALTIYAAYLFVSETFLGITVASTPFSLLAGVALIAAIPLLKESFEDIKNKKFTLQTFMGTTLVGTIFFGEVMAAFEIIYILRGGMLLEEYIANKSKDEIHRLVELDIKKVFILEDSYELEIDLDDLTTKHTVVVRTGEKIPVDGIISDGESDIDESIINGRSEPVFKTKGDEVYAGTICQRGRIYIKVSAIGNETYISRTMKKVEIALAQKSPSVVEADILANRLLKLGTLLTIGTFVFTGSLISAFSVMIVMSCPCATILAASTAVSAGIANGAKNGILIKGGEALENVSKSQVFCFDKTGTLTTGKPLVTDIILEDGVSKEKLFEYALIAEHRNTHPIAKSLTDYSKSLGLQEKDDSISTVIPGFGVKTKYKDHFISVGNSKLMEEENINISKYQTNYQQLLEDGKTVVFIAYDNQILGMVSFVHEVRDGTKEMIETLKKHGVKHIALITGDETKVANFFAKEFTFDSVYSNQTPQDKANTIELLKQQYGQVVMVGDGVNDAYAMSKADVAISFAAGGSEVAIAVSDIAVTHSHPDDVVYLYNLSKQTLSVVNQNYYIGTGTNLIGVALSALGKLSPVGAGLIHIGHTVGIMANSAKLLRPNNISNDIKS